MINFNDNLREFRREKNMTQKELADAVYVTAQAVSRWEQGITSPDPDMVKKIAAVLEISAGALLGEDSSLQQSLAEAASTSAEEVNHVQTPIIGMCKICGITVNKNNLGGQSPVTCKECMAKEKRKKQLEEYDKAQKSIDYTNAALYAAAKAHKRGLIFGSIIGGAGIIFSIVFQAVISVLGTFNIVGMLIDIVLFGYAGFALGYTYNTSSWNCIRAMDKFKKKSYGAYLILVIIFFGFVLLAISLCILVFVLYSFFTCPYFLYNSSRTIKQCRTNLCACQSQKDELQKKYKL